MEGIEIKTTDTGFSLKICGVEFGDITELINISIEAPTTSIIKLECNLCKFLKKMQAIKYSQGTSITQRERKWKRNGQARQMLHISHYNVSKIKIKIKRE